MTIELFIFMLTIGAMISSLLTQAMKQAFKNISSNILALIDAIIIGIIGMVLFYFLMGIPFTLQNIICIPLMALCIWIGSMIGYDKCLQTLEQIKKGWDYV